MVLTVTDISNRAAFVSTVIQTNGGLVIQQVGNVLTVEAMPSNLAAIVLSMDLGGAILALLPTGVVASIEGATTCEINLAAGP